MGKMSRAKKHANKMRMRRSAKAAKRVAYAAMRGTSKKNKKIRARGRNASIHKHLHLIANCGNIGCGHCFPEFVRTISNGRVAA